MLKQFGGSLSEDNEKLRRFAVFRASEIKKALDEGLKPPPLTPPEDPSTSSDILESSPCESYLEAFYHTTFIFLMFHLTTIDLPLVIGGSHKEH